MLDAKEILNYLPHRYPFLLVDRIIDIQGDEKIIAIKNVSFNEPFFQGHFPELEQFLPTTVAAVWTIIGFLCSPALTKSSSSVR
jgi:3-hydroxymyristoyl/3-hydroxydecanoyl-(acyl carrier protein) dehydratase